MNIGERIKALRESRELTLEQVGAYLGVNKATVQRYESGNIDIKRNVAIRLAEILHTTPAYIMGWTNETAALSPLTSLTEDESDIIDMYRALNEEGRQYIKQSLKMAQTTYANPDQEDTVRVYRAAKSEGNTPGQVVDVPRSLIKKLQDAPKVKSDDEI